MFDLGLFAPACGQVQGLGGCTCSDVGEVTFHPRRYRD